MKKLLYCIFILFIIIYSAFGYAKPEEKGTITIAIDTNSEITLNPYVASENYSVVILSNLVTGLFEHEGKTGSPVNALAKSYEVSPDGLDWTFNLRKAFFSNGHQITSYKILSSWNYLIQGPLASNLSFVKRRADGSLDIDTPDSLTLVVHLSHPVPYLPDLLCQPSLGAIEGMNSYSGAYTLVSQTENEIVLKENPRYWGDVRNSSIRIINGSDFDNDFAEGKIQWSMAPINNASGHMITTPLYATTFFYFSAKDGPYADPRVRKALASIIPWDLVRYMQETIVPAESLVPDSKVTAKQIASVSTLLSEAGFPGGSGLPPIKIGMHRGASDAAAAEVIADLWSRYLGVTVLLDTVPVTVYTQEPYSNPYDFCNVTWIADYSDPEAFLDLFCSNASYNIANYCDAKYDSIIEESHNMPDEKSRIETLKKAEQYLLDSRSVIPVSVALATDFVRKDLIKGWNANRMDSHPFKDLQLRK